MNPKQRNKVIILIVLGVIVVFLLWWQLFRPTEQDRIYQENLAKSRAQTAGVTDVAATGAGAADAGVPGGEEAAAPGVAPAPAAAGPAAAPAGGTQIQRSDVNIDELVAGIKAVDFDYDEVAADINPMTPLVGPFAPPRVATAEGAGVEGPAIRQDVQALVRNIRVTGIMWDKRDPMAVVSFPIQGEQVSEIITRGYTFPELGVTVHDIETDRVVLNINGVLVPIELEER